jgi:hypothetical protein
MTPSSIQRIVTGDPALVFLKRGSQLARLQQRIIMTIQSEITAESGESAYSFASLPSQPSPGDISAYLKGVLGSVEASKLRQRDIQMMFQLFYCRYVDDFQTFLEHLLRDIAIFEPTLLCDVPIKKSAQNLPSPERIQRQRRKLSYMSIREISDALTSHFKIFTSLPTRTGVEQIYELRNLYVHNHGIADAHFLARFTGPRYIEGQPVELDHNFVGAAVNTLIVCCGDIRNRASSQFGISWEN